MVEFHDRREQSSPKDKDCSRCGQPINTDNPVVSDAKGNSGCTYCVPEEEW